MSDTDWRRVLDADLAVPTDRSLVELTTELTEMLGSTDPVVRAEIACPVLATWISRGVYDDLLTGLGDGMAAGLTHRLGERDTDSVFRRSFSALVLSACIDRDNHARLLPDTKLLEWGDRIGTWLVREQDVRGFVPGKGWAHAVAHGADALGVISASPHFGRNELVVLLDVIADRLLQPAAAQLVSGETDRLAAAMLAVLSRDLVPSGVVRSLVNRIAAGAALDAPDGSDPFLAGGNADAFLRSLYLQGTLPTQTIDADVVTALATALASARPHYFGSRADRTAQ